MHKLKKGRKVKKRYRKLYVKPVLIKKYKK